ncbi:hypothetical protein BH09ACT7_BH09ACT7_47440 [soil metagenome]
MTHPLVTIPNDFFRPDSLTIASMGIHAFGTGNEVTVGPGPFAIAISVFQNHATVTRQGPGVNLDGLTLGGADTAPAGVVNRTARPSVATLSPKNKAKAAAAEDKTKQDAGAGAKATSAKATSHRKK